MAITGRFLHSGIFFLLVLLFIPFELWCFSTNHLKWMVVFLFGVSGVLAWFFFYNEKHISSLAFPLYLIIAGSMVLLNINHDIEIEFYFLFAFLLFFPIIINHYWRKVRLKYIPGTGAISLMLIGFFGSAIYQFIIRGGVYEYPLKVDLFFLAAILIFFAFYMLLAVGILSVRHLIIALSIAVLPALLFHLIAVIREGSLAPLLSERFGNRGVLSPNGVASILDFCLPTMLFLALYEKKRMLKFLFWALAVFYCLCLLLTSSRGSIPGLLALLVFLIIRSRSIKIWFIVTVLAIGFFGFFGSHVARRILTPSRSELYSNLGRVEMMKSARSILKTNNYFWGIGMDNFRIEKFKYGFSRAFDNRMGMSSHNVFLEIWLGWGLPGLLGWISLLIGLIFRILRARLPSEINYLKFPLVFAMLSFILHSFVESAISLFMFIVFPFSLLACMALLIKQDERKKPAVTSQHLSF